jgi:DNA-binding MarR family transcriptional regulator
MTSNLENSSAGIVQQLRRAYLSVSRCRDVMFSPYRLTGDQYALMRAVQKNPGIRQSDLGDEIFAEPNTVTAMVTLLEKRGILRRKPSATDGRVRLLSLTPHGNAVMNRLSQDWTSMRLLLRECFAGEDGRRALEILDRVYQEMKRERENQLRKAHAFGPVQSELAELEPASPADGAVEAGTKAPRKTRSRQSQQTTDEDDRIGFTS